MFKPVSVQISNIYDFAIEKHPFTIGVPWSEGAITSQQHLRLTCNGQAKQFNTRPLAFWPDGSVKWMLLDFQASMDACGQSDCQLECDVVDHTHAYQPDESARLEISEADEGFRVNTGLTQFAIDKHKFNLLSQVVYDNHELLADAPGELQLLDEQGNPADSVISSITCHDTDNSLRKNVCIDGTFQNSSKEKLAVFNLILTFYAGLSTVKCEFTLWNPAAAEHPGGVWDLGDSGSLLFKELSISLRLADSGEANESSIRLSPDKNWQSVASGSLKLEQNSSGGENWQSSNHMNARGEVPLQFRGYRYYEHYDQVASGDRATPCVYLSALSGGVCAYIADFWQNFPKGIEANSSSLSLKLFPLNTAGCYELQGGEKKKHTFYLDFSNNRNALDGYITDIVPRISLEYYSATKVIPWLPGFHEDSALQALIDRGIEGENNFFEKRETIDEYGWRNFGEIYADHEQLEYKGSEEFVSHYNNQYDPVYGFLKQYLVSGDSRWHELLSSLAQHVADIDIYHTIEDRDEYNGGLFWHTHHYLTAFTCTHRTFSGRHASDFLYGEIGGGPGTEHCYTTGLACFYFMTGDEAYKNAALQLANWVTRLMEGSGTVIERVFQFKSKELPIIKRLLAGETVQRYKYPFTRGTGNYITSLIDAYNLTGEHQYIVDIECVIRQSIHPQDDITLRNLKDTEASWSYVIYLQAICKYLNLKTSIREIDDACLYAKDSLLHYVDWMLENETPFLQAPEQLEYPNHTWTAQDLRKANIFYIASLYSENKRTEYLKTAEYYVRYVEETLKSEETRHFSRILVLLMQNDIHEAGLDYDAAEVIRNHAPGKYSTAPLYSIPGIITRLISDLAGRMVKLSIKNEKRWLSFRMK